MAFFKKLKRFADGVVAQVNPFDDGKDFNNPYKAAPQQPSNPNPRPRRSNPVSFSQTNNSPGSKAVTFDNTFKQSSFQTPKIETPTVSKPTVKPPVIPNQFSQPKKFQANTDITSMQLDKNIQQAQNKFSEPIRKKFEQRDNAVRQAAPAKLQAIQQRYKSGEISRAQRSILAEQAINPHRRVVQADDILAATNPIDKATNAIVGGFADINAVRLGGQLTSLGGNVVTALGNKKLGSRIEKTGNKLASFGDTKGTAMDAKYDDGLVYTALRAAPALAQDTTLALATGGGSLGVKAATNSGKAVTIGAKTLSALKKVGTGTGLVGTLHGATTANDIADDAVKKGVNPQRALATGAGLGIANAILEKAGGDALLNNPVGRKLTQSGASGIASKLGGAIGSYMSEGSEEAAQQVAENVARRTYDKNQKLTDGVKESFLVGGALGAAANVPAQALQLNQAKENLRKQSVNPEDIDTKAQQQIADNQKEYLDKIDPTKNAIPLDESGHIKTPNSNPNNDPLPTIKSFASEFDNVNDFNKTLRDFKEVELGRQELTNPEGYAKYKKIKQEIADYANSGGESFPINDSWFNSVKTAQAQIPNTPNIAPQPNSIDPIDVGRTPTPIPPQENINTQQPKGFILREDKAGNKIRVRPRADGKGFEAYEDTSGTNQINLKDYPFAKWEDLFQKHLGHDNTAFEQQDVGKEAHTSLLRKATNKIDQKFFEMSKKEGAGQKIVRSLQYLDKTIGQDPTMLEAASRLRGDAVYTDAALAELADKTYSLIPTNESRERVHSLLDPNAANQDLKVEDLSPQEKEALFTLRDIGETINDTAFEMGQISRKKWESNRGGKYIARLYKEVEATEDVEELLDLPKNKGLSTGMFKQRKQLTENMKAALIRDPIKLAVIRARQIRSNGALTDYINDSVSKGYVSNTPKQGYVKVDERKKGTGWENKYVRQDVYENVEGFTSAFKSLNGLNAMLDAYDGLPPRRIRKMMLTVYNPVVQTGNITSNYAFAWLNGLNPVKFGQYRVKAGKALKTNDPIVLALRKEGVIGNNLLQNDKNLFNQDKQFDKAINQNRSILTKTNDAIVSRYSKSDDLGKIAAVMMRVEKGMSLGAAITETKKGFQDYSRVGHMYDLAAKSPVFGNAFVRFQGDLYLSILKNSAIDHPFKAGAMLVATRALGELLSNLSGESDEDKKTRENRPGAPVIPFTNISTEFQIPKVGAVDASRYFGIYTRQDLDGLGATDNISRIAPINIFNPLKLGTDEGRADFFQKAASDPLIGAAISTLADVDWRGKSIKDPTGIRNGAEVYPDEPLSQKDKNRNVRQYLLRSYAPYPFNELQDIYRSYKGAPETEQTQKGSKKYPDNTDKSILKREGYNTAGQKKTVAQALARPFGLRIETFGKEEAQASRDKKDLFDMFDRKEKFVKGLDNQTKQRFEARHPQTQQRSGLKKDFEDDPFYKYRNATELQDDKLFEAEKKYAQIDKKFGGKPIDPLFDLPSDQRKLVLWKKTLPPGAKDPTVSKMYDQPWYQDYQQKTGEFFAAKEAWKKEQGFDTKSASANPYPKLADDVQKQMDLYYSLDKGARKRFVAANPDTYQQFKNFWEQKDNWTTAERTRVGLGAIDKTNQYASNSGKRSGGGRSKGGRRSGSKTKTAKLSNPYSSANSNIVAYNSLKKTIQPVKSNKFKKRTYKTKKIVAPKTRIIA